jgi:hypothetical protein
MLGGASVPYGKLWRPGAHTAAVRAQELGRARAKAETLGSPIETFTIRADPAGADARMLVLEWERTRVRIPLSP